MTRKSNYTQFHKGPWQTHTGEPCPINPDTLVEFRVSGSPKLSVPTRARDVQWDWRDTVQRWRVTSWRVLTRITEEGTEPR